MVVRLDEIEIRPAEHGRDADLIRSLDPSFETAAILEVQRDGYGFLFVEKPVDPLVAKSFPLVDFEIGRGEWETAWLALAADQAVGVVATQREQWNRRVIIRHFYVDRGLRRQGIGRRLLDTALDAAREAGSRTAWLETSNLNVPGIRAYERLGFELCGLDLSLYDGTAAEGEVALFLRRSLPHPVA
jgi:ribosomal protein S18 acetylase RimI-like enzyme